MATAPAGKATSDIVTGLCPRGHLIALGVAPDPMELSSSALIFGSRSIDGALTGDPATGDTEDIVDREKLFELHQAGNSVRTIAAAMGLTRSTVHAIVSAKAS